MDSLPSTPSPRPLSDERRRRVRRLQTRKQRERAGEVLIEGPRALSAAIRGGARISFVVVEEGRSPMLEELEDLEQPGGSGAHGGREGREGREASAAGGELDGRGGHDGPGGLLSAILVNDLYSASPAIFRTLALTQQPQGILAVADQPRWGLESVPSPRSWGGVPILILDGLQDPGNLGTLLRSAAAMRCPAVILLEGTVDPWSPKVVRAAAGEMFGIPVVQAVWRDVAAWLESEGVPLWLASASGEDVRELSHEADAPIALVLGNEGRGARNEVIAWAARSVGIPLEGTVESLNAAQAGTLLLWALGPGRWRRPTVGDSGQTP